MEKIELKNPAFSKGFKSHLHKAAEIHKAIAEHHGSIAKAHTEHAAFAKGKHDAMDDGDVLKSFMGKVAAHHEMKAAHHTNLHKAYTNLAEENKNLADQVVEEQPIQTSTIQGKAAAGGEPTAAAAPATGTTAEPLTGVDALIGNTVEGLLKKSLETLNNDPKIAEMIQKTLIEKINQVVGDKILPSAVTGVVPGAPTAVTRLGAPSVNKAADVPAEFSELVSVGE